MGHHDTLTQENGEIIASVKQIITNRLDTKIFKKNEKDIYAKYTKTTNIKILKIQE